MLPLRRVTLIDLLDVQVFNKLVRTRSQVEAVALNVCTLCSMDFQVATMKKRCRHCRALVCRTCTEKILVQSIHFTHHDPQDFMVASVCLTCFHNIFGTYVVGFVDGMPIPSKKAFHAGHESVARLRTPQSLPPLDRRTSTPIYIRQIKLQSPTVLVSPQMEN